MEEFEARINKLRVERERDRLIIEGDLYFYIRIGVYEGMRVENDGYIRFSKDKIFRNEGRNLIRCIGERG